MNGKTPILLCGLLTIASPAASHHNFAAHYRVEETIEISGVVTEFRFVNPHARVYVAVTNEGGEIEQWMAEGDASVGLKRSGWTADQLKQGDRVEITGSPSRNGSNTLSWHAIALADGTLFGGGDGRENERLRILDRGLAEFRGQRGR
ncbi:MAG TPA: DUF6152 family protein [Gammaproteobacteria bacterium]